MSNGRVTDNLTTHGKATIPSCVQRSTLSLLPLFYLRFVKALAKHATLVKHPIEVTSVGSQLPILYSLYENSSFVKFRSILMTEAKRSNFL